MPFQLSNSLTPKENSLVVCAGTMTISQVDGMGSGFSLFKKIFDKHGSCNNYKGGWHAELQLALDGYFNKNAPMPPYIRLAAQDTLIGSVATVPVFSGPQGLNHELFADTPTKEKKFKDQYKLAVQHAILDAKNLKRPLFLQPLGIGVYGWDPKVAAVLFVEAICETDPNDEVDITIPIYSITKNSNDQVFQETFEAEMTQKRPNKVKEEPQVKSNQGINKTPLDAKTSSDIKFNNKSNKIILSDIVGTLINNIENKQGNRWTSGANSRKLEQLKLIQGSINDKTELDVDSDEYQQYAQDILKICQNRRNPLHFWHTPESVNEFLTLLEKHHIKIKPIF